MNVDYAYQAGNIFYACNGAIPRRSAGFDWTRPVDGSNSWAGTASDTYVPEADTQVPLLLEDWTKLKQVGPARAEK